MQPKTYTPYLATLPKHKSPKPNKGKNFLCCDEVVKKYKLPENTECSYVDHIADDFPESHFDFLHFRTLEDGTNIKVCCLVYSALMKKLYGDNWVHKWLKDPTGTLKKPKKRYKYAKIELNESVIKDMEAKNG